MKRLIILGDGMADEPAPEWQGMTPLAYAHTPNIDRLAAQGRCGMLRTIPDGMSAGSEIANLAILGYDVRRLRVGRGVLEAASRDITLLPGEIVLRCNLVTMQDDILVDHMAGGISTEEASVLVRYLQEKLSPVYGMFHVGERYRHLLVTKGGGVRLTCTPPHELWKKSLLQHPIAPLCEEAEDTAKLLNELVREAGDLLSEHPVNRQRIACGKLPANGICLWGVGECPQLLPLSERYPTLRKTAMITATEVMRGIARYTGMDVLHVDGATGLHNTDYEGKARAAIEAMKTYDLVYLHIEAADEASHEGNLQLKKQIIEDVDARLVRPILLYLAQTTEPIRIAFLPDHATSCVTRSHLPDPVPFLVYEAGITPDAVRAYHESACSKGSLGCLEGADFMDMFAGVKDLS